jgi:hypothetical protein
MPLWTKRDRFATVAATVAATGEGGPETGLEPGLIAELWDDCCSVVRVAATRGKRPGRGANGRGCAGRAPRWGGAS